MLPPDWQLETLGSLRALLEPNDDAVALVLFGSLTDDRYERDVWADVDVMLVVRDGAFRQFFPSVDWLAPVGALWAYERSTRERHGVVRACFKDTRRADIVIVEENVVADIASWDGQPLHGPRRVIFSRSAALDEAAATFSAPIEARPYTDAQFAELANDFRFAGQIAVKKVVRGDLLIALHLALGLVRDCCVLEMLLRDRAANTRYHRDGGPAEEIVARLGIMSQPYTRAGILDTIEQAALMFDRLAARWSQQYEARSAPLLRMLADARRA